MNFENVEQFLDQKLKGYKKLTDKAYILEFDQKYILKKSYKNINPFYNYLKSQHVDTKYPLAQFQIDGSLFYLMTYEEEDFYPVEKKIYDLRQSLQDLHYLTKVSKSAKKNSFKYLYRLFKKLDYQFRLLDSYIYELELKEVHEDDDWIFLAKYYKFLDCKKELYRLQMKIHNDIDNNISLSYVILHGYPSINHLIHKRLINFENSHFGYAVSDIVRLYCLNEDIKIDWFNFIDEWLSEYDSFGKLYFKFLVLYIFVMNIHVPPTIDYMFLTNYVTIEKKINKVMTIFNNY